MNASLSRVQVTMGCPAAPGKCACCGSFSGEMLDFGMELDFYGVVYLCIDNCLRQFANSVGYLSPGQAQELLAQRDMAVEKVSELEDRVEELSNVVDAIDIVRAGVSRRDPEQLLLDLEFSEDPGESGQDDGEGHRSTDVEPPTDDGRSVDNGNEDSGGETRPPEQDAKPGPSDVQRNDRLNAVFEGFDI